MKTRFLKLLIRMFRYHGLYLWGGQGELVNQLSNDDIRDREGDTANALKVINFMNMLKAYNLVKKDTRAFDCSGLICWALVEVGREKKGFDMKADNLFEHYPHYTKLAPGMLVHRKGHIACYIGYDHVIEARGRDWGVVISPFNKEDWDRYYANPWEK